MGWTGLLLVVDMTGGLGPSQTQCWEAFGSSLARPSALSLHSWHLSCIILHRFVTNNINVLSSKLVSKAVDFWRLGVNILVDLLVSFLTSMVHCMSGISFGCIVWCPSAFTSLPGLESCPLRELNILMLVISIKDVSMFLYNVCRSIFNKKESWLRLEKGILIKRNYLVILSPNNNRICVCRVK